MTPARPRLAGLVAAAVVAATGLVGLSAGTANAAVCSSSGISAVVDAAGAGGGTETYCDPIDSAKDASGVFQDVKVSVRRNPDGSVCQVNGKPAGVSCHGLGTQYWGLFWSNGKDARWIYAQLGDTSLIIPKNGSVAWAWQNGSGQHKPGAAAPVVKATPTPTPTRAPTRAPSKTPQPTRTPRPTKTPQPTKTPVTSQTPRATQAGTTPATSPTAPAANAVPSATGPSRAAALTASASAATTSASATPEPSDTSSVEPAATTKASSAFAPEEQHSGLPAWIPVSVILLLALAAGGGLWWRNRSGTS